MGKRNLNCPECGASMQQNRTICCCGWIRVRSTIGTARADHRCDFQDRWGRCAHQGTISPNVRGGGPWYCQKHYKQQCLGEQ